MQNCLNDLGIKTKLIFIFVLIKIVPLLIIALIAIFGARQMQSYYVKDSIEILNKSTSTVKNTADVAIRDSIKALDKKSQTSIERLAIELAKHVSQFLYERDQDLLTLANAPISPSLIRAFYQSKTGPVTTHLPYQYDDRTHSWKPAHSTQNVVRKLKEPILIDNQKEFHKNPPNDSQTKQVPIYREITYYDINGQERYKMSSISNVKKNISQKKNTYLKAENYFNPAKRLKKGEIYVSNVIGAYRPSSIIGPYTKIEAQKKDIPFQPEKAGYAGKENPVGKKFEGIIRFVTPVYRHNKRAGYITLALDHRHIMEITDHVVPIKSLFSDISDAEIGNYAFMWDYLGRNISHPRDHSIIGYNPENGKQVPGWISQDLEKRWKQSGISDLNRFLKTVPPFEAQSLSKKPSLIQTQKGEVGLDCRYLNFAPQCHGWMQLTEDGGSGSFIILWTGVWKLTTAAAIPYYTGQYRNSKRGFGFITIGANVDEFHEAANSTRENIEKLISEQSEEFNSTIQDSKNRIIAYINSVMTDLTLSTVLMIAAMIAIAVWLSNHLMGRISLLLSGTREFSNNNLKYRIPIASKDEMGQLAIAFNQMANKIFQYQNHQEDVIRSRTNELSKKNIRLRQVLDEVRFANKKVTDSIKYARLIQHSLLPDLKTVEECFQEKFIIWEPRDIVGGDIYFIDHTQNGFLVCLVDCTGHGVPGAFMTIITIAGIRQIVHHDKCTDPAEILRRLNQFVRNVLHQGNEETLSDDGLEAAICYGNKIDRTLTFAGSGSSLIATDTYKTKIYKGDRETIGFKRSDVNFQFNNTSISVTADRSFYLFTDGYFQQTGGERGIMFGKKRLAKLLSEIHHLSFDEQKRKILKQIKNYQGNNSRKDDISAIGFKFPKK